MENTEKRPLASSSQHSQHTRKTRSRIGAACIRCQKRKIRCDAMLPACSSCQRAGVECVGGGTSREIPRSYVNDLEARIEWLESIVREKVPAIDLSTVPDHRSNSSCGPVVPQDSTAPLSLQENDPIEDDDGSLRQISDQIGLVSVAAGTDLRYLGPSSGLFFTRYVLTGLGRRIQIEKAPTLDSIDDGLSVPPDLLVVQPKELPSDQRQARWLSQAYFENVHLQFPFLHEPTHLETIRKLYDGVEVGPVHEFQVFMVLAIGATILSRRAKVILSGEGYYASATSRLDSVVQTTSLSGVQCILLLQMYTLNNPSSGLSLWPLHYHGLGQTIELGLQRNVPGKVFTVFEEQMRTRIFWCIYTIDRLLSTLMGRPIGVMDEQCDLRLPLDVNDDDLTSDQQKPRQEGDPLTTMSSAIHLFKLARFNSEIKSVLYCVDRQYPPYTHPVVANAGRWKADILNRLRQWKEQIPRHPEGRPQHYMNLVCEIKYHELFLLVLRPSPRFQHPDRASLRECLSSAMDCSKLYYKLYTAKSLHYGWISVHSLFLCTMVIFYCVWTPQGVADEADFDCLMRALKASSDILSAMGEYWPEATRCRDVLDRVSTATIRRFTQTFHKMPSNTSALGSQGAMNLTSNLSSEQSPDWIEVDPTSNSFPSLHFESGDAGSGLFSSDYGAQDDSFMSADILSFFLGSGADVAMDGAGIAGDYYPGADGLMWSSFGDGQQGFESGK